MMFLFFFIWCLPIYSGLLPLYLCGYLQSFYLCYISETHADMKNLASLLIFAIELWTDFN